MHWIASLIAMFHFHPFNHHAPPPKKVPHKVVKLSAQWPWPQIRECESGRGVPDSVRAKTNTGNGYYGAYQFGQRSWAGAGGLKYAARADLATLEQQTQTAINLAKIQGYGAWPVCRHNAGA